MTKTESFLPGEVGSSSTAPLSPQQGTETAMPAHSGLSPQQGTETAFPAQGTAPSPSSLPPSAPTEGAAAPRTIGGFALVRQLGQGGMATVYEAVSPGGARVALKQVREEARRDEQFIQRFLREVRAASKLSHPNICRVLAGGEDDSGDVYMAVELLGGGDLDGLLERCGGRLPAAMAAVLISQVLEGLAHAHERGIVHRDIKPANVMLSSDGVVKLVDFGIARNDDDQRMTATGLVVGTPGYMSPEQARGTAVDGRSDLFSVGVMLVVLLTGRNPFLGDTATATVLKILSEHLPPLSSIEPTIPGVLVHVADRLLRKRPDDRYQTATEALGDLAPYVRLLDNADGLLKMALQAPADTVSRLRQQQASDELRRADELTGAGPDADSAIALALQRAALLTADPAIRARFETFCRDKGFAFGADDARLQQLREETRREPTSPVLWRRLADVARACRDPHTGSEALRTYLMWRPDDALAFRQWRVLAYGPDLAAVDPQAKARLTTREIMDGLRTGGWKAAAPGIAASPPPREPRRAEPPPPAARPVASSSSPRPTPRAPSPEPDLAIHSSTSGGGLPWRPVAAVLAGLVVVGVGIRIFASSVETSATVVKTAMTETAKVQSGAIDRGLQMSHADLLRQARQAVAQQDWLAVDRLTSSVILGEPAVDQLTDALALRARANLEQGQPRKALADAERYRTHAGPSHGAWYDVDNIFVRAQSMLDEAPTPAR
jgi:tRNA A-37 threonylcarbamoyl transferase component Bud32